ncbi:TetR/AcrR family transcriptional regulator [Silvibacterium acidisoli]|uniref:TetR/AcrR family transcriptional regulator n=1 Tax=Acidobacteriaceae bacterium ZG23-2 TaxID=2883246 RepID=UPI00406C124C
MPSPFPKTAPRKPRADAAKNRAHILAVAKEVFYRKGGEVSMDEIAKLAGVGPGTLYRHFANRTALLEAVYRIELEKLAAAEREFTETLPPVEAVRAWMTLFVDYLAAKQILAPALSEMMAQESCSVYSCAMDVIGGAITRLVGRAIASGEVRPDVNGMDLLWALFGVLNGNTAPDLREKAKRLVEILILGSRTA